MDEVAPDEEDDEEEDDDDEVDDEDDDDDNDATLKRSANKYESGVKTDRDEMLVM